MDSDRTANQEQPSSRLTIALAWLIVVIPLSYGLWQTIVKAGLLLSGG